MKRVDERDLLDIELRVRSSRRRNRKKMRVAEDDFQVLIDEIRELWWEKEHVWMVDDDDPSWPARTQEEEQEEDNGDSEEAESDSREDRQCGEASGPCAEYDIGTCRPALPFV